MSCIERIVVASLRCRAWEVVGRDVIFKDATNETAAELLDHIFKQMEYDNVFSNITIKEDKK